MDKNTIINQVGQKIATQILDDPHRTIIADESLISSGLIDSFSLVDLALIVEELYDVQIDDAELTADTFDSLSQLADLILARQ